MFKEIHVFPNSLKIRNCKDLYGKPFKCSEVVTVSLVQYRGTNGMTLPTDDTQDKRMSAQEIILIARFLFRKTKQDQIPKNVKNQARILSFYEMGNLPLQYVTLLRFLAMVHCT